MSRLSIADACARDTNLCGCIRYTENLLNVGAAPLDGVLDENISSDGPLEGGEMDTDAGLGDLGLVEGDDGRGDTDGNTRDGAADNEHAAVLCSGLEDGADDPDSSSDDDCPLATDEIGELGDSKSTDEGAGRHGGHDGPLVGVHRRYMRTTRCTVDR